MADDLVTFYDWLAQRLTPIKQDEARWVDYAKAIQRYWEENFDPILDEIEASKSIYTASDAALEKRLLELGDFYPVDSLTGGEDKILAIAWRNLALYFKDARYLIESTLLRKFGTLDVRWVELYHKKDIEYGNEFLGASRITTEGGDLSKYFLTCHASVDVDQPDLDAMGIPLETFVEQAWNEVSLIRPAHIVFHGVQIFEEVPTTIPMFSLVKSADIVVIAPDLFDLVIADTPVLSASFVRTAEVLSIAAIENDIPDPPDPTYESYGDTVDCQSIEVNWVTDTSPLGIADFMTDKYYDRISNAIINIEQVRGVTEYSWDLGVADPDLSIGVYAIAISVGAYRYRATNKQWTDAVAGNSAGSVGAITSNSGSTIYMLWDSEYNWIYGVESLEDAFKLLKYYEATNPVVLGSGAVGDEYRPEMGTYEFAPGIDNPVSVIGTGIVGGSSQTIVIWVMLPVCGGGGE